MTRDDTKTFITKVLERHPDNISKFDYSRVIYTLSKNKVTLTCLKCNHRFEQEANSHFRGTGCPACAGRAVFGQDDFITCSRSKHGDTYDYSLVDYIHTHQKVDIVCKKHGVFKQTPSNHLQGQGCRKCTPYYPLDTQTFIKRATEVHNGLYSYDSTEYISSRVELTITCPIHGDFRQKANNHIMGGGCPSCRKETSKGGVNLKSMLKRPETYQATDSYLYFIEIVDGKGTFKIGKGNTPTSRVYDIKMQSGFDCKLTYQTPSTTYNVLLVEQYLHDLLKHKRSDVSGFGGYTECFFLEPEEVSDAIELADNLLKDLSEIETYYRDLYRVYKE